MRGEWGTLRARTTLLAVALAGLTLIVGAVVLTVVLSAQLTASGDALAKSRVRDLLDLAASGQLASSLDNVNDEGVAQVVDANGRVLAASPNITGRPALDDVGDPAGPLEVRTIDAPDDDETERYRIWTATGPGTDGRVRVFVGTSLESVSEASATLRSSLLVGVPMVLVLLAIATWVVLGRALRRVERIRAEVDAITQDQLHRRVPTSSVDDEVGRLASTMNSLLDRLEQASARQRAFIADVSHDLQSPLTAQRAQLEVALARPDQTEPTALAHDLLVNTAQMEQLVRDLLYLATDDAGRPSVARVSVDLDDIVLEEATRARHAARVRIDTSAVSAAPTRGDRGDLQRLIRNLIDNAVHYAESVVVLRAAADDTGVRLDVMDDGPGIPAAERERVFERFHQGDPARSRNRSGSGLGLAIARTIALRHGGALGIQDTDGGGAHFVLRLPGPD